MDKEKIIEEDISDSSRETKQKKFETPYAE